MTPCRTLVAILSVPLFAAACSSDSAELVAEAGVLGHIHDIVLTDDGELLVATWADVDTQLEEIETHYFDDDR